MGLCVRGNFTRLRVRMILYRGQVRTYGEAPLNECALPDHVRLLTATNDACLVICSPYPTEHPGLL